MFFDDARDGRANVVGEPGDGWRVAMATSLRARRHQCARLSVPRSCRVRPARGRRPGSRPGRDVRCGGGSRSAGPASGDAAQQRAHAHPPPARRALGPEASFTKVFWSRWHRTSATWRWTARRRRPVLDGEPAEGYRPSGLVRSWLTSRSETIYAGTTEIQLNIIGERVLGLPKDTPDQRADRTRAQKEGSWTSDLTDEQRMLQKAARTSSPHLPAREGEGVGRGRPPCRPSCSAGWPTWAGSGCPSPRSDGGGGGGPVELALIAEELGRASLDVAMCYIGSLIPGLTLYQWGTPEQRERDLLGALMTGETRLAVAISEPDAGSDAAALRTARRGPRRPLRRQRPEDVVHRRGPAGHRRSRCTSAPGRASPKHGGLSLLLVDPATRRRRDPPDADARPPHPRHQRGLPDRRPWCRRTTWSARWTAGWKVMLSSLELERVLMSGGYVGAAQATLDEALAYSKERQRVRPPDRARSRPSRTRMADLQTEIDAARLLAYRAAWLLAQRPAVHPGGRDGQAEGLGDLRRRRPARHAGPAPATASPPRAS